MIPTLRLRLESATTPSKPKELRVDFQSITPLDGLTMYASHETRGLFAVQHDPNLPPPDVVTIGTASYKTSTRELTVYATSSLQPTPTLTVVGLGTMTWSRRNNRYEFLTRINSAPASVQVTSSGRGTATKTVTIR